MQQDIEDQWDAFYYLVKLFSLSFDSSKYNSERLLWCLVQMTVDKPY